MKQRYQIKAETPDHDIEHHEARTKDEVIFKLGDVVKIEDTVTKRIQE